MPEVEKPKSKIPILLIVVVFIALVAIAGVAAYFIFGKSTESTSSKSSSTSSSKTATASTVPAGWKSLTTEQVEGCGCKPFTISYPSTWTATQDKKADSLHVLLEKDSYQISINQGVMDGTNCVFSDTDTSVVDPNGPMVSDLRSKTYAEVVAKFATLRRYILSEKSGVVRFGFCAGKDANSMLSLTPICVITYITATDYTPAGLLEMDRILQTITTH